MGRVVLDGVSDFFYYESNFCFFLWGGGVELGNFLYIESESKKIYVFFGRGWAGGGDRRWGGGGGRVSECFTMNQNSKKIFFFFFFGGGGGWRGGGVVRGEGGLSK